ncbi:MAG: hypothetical protein J6Y02_19185 [Pseudobutyrivibrio sp.]|nr:hypothetical protein [Pseudobutyrivibrio sp.]
MIFRGTTPTIMLKINNQDFNAADISVCHITIENESGRNQKIFPASIDTETKILSAELTQEDTLSFEKGYIYIQAKIKLNNDRVITHDKLRVQLKDILEQEII